MVIDVPDVLYDATHSHRWLLQLVNRLGVGVGYAEFYRAAMRSCSTCIAGGASSQKSCKPSWSASGCRRRRSMKLKPPAEFSGRIWNKTFAPWPAQSARWKG